MTGIRLLIAISLVCSASAFAQVKTDPAIPSNNAAYTGKSLTASNAEPWKILPQSPAASSLPTTSSAPSPMDRLADPFLLTWNDGLTVLNGNVDPRMVVSQRAIGDDSYCLKIRSYVVKRDSKDSDAVHPAGYTTCVPASRFRLRTTLEHQTSERESHLIQR